MRASLANLDEGEFTEGHELDRKWKVAKEIIGRRLSQTNFKSVTEYIAEYKDWLGSPGPCPYRMEPQWADPASGTADVSPP